MIVLPGAKEEVNDGRVKRGFDGSRLAKTLAKS
jgi:hypothetical protein